MSIFRIGKDQLEHFTIVANPYQTFTSSSAGATGSVYVLPRRTDIQKDVGPSSAFVDTRSDDSSVEGLLQSIKGNSSSDIRKKVESYMTAVNSKAPPSRRNRSLDILRFVPSFTFTADTSAKILIKDKLMPFYRSVRSSYQWGFTNYHTLNFFTSSKVPENSALLYPNVYEGTNFASASYNVTGAFTFEMYLNPRYTTDNALEGASFKAGTILHLSSTYALSLVTGSSHDENGYPNGYRLLLQLSSSAEVVPSKATAGNRPNDLIFLSDDNSLRRNQWHHVVVRWGTRNVDHGTGSFVIDGQKAGTFVIPSASIALPESFAGEYPDVLCVGNFYEGSNAGTSAQSRFFSADPAERDGLVELEATADVDFPDNYRFSHPLNAEIHDLSIRNVYLNDSQLDNSRGKSIVDLSNVLFYVPPFFTAESPFRKMVGTHGGVPATPFFERDDTTIDPFNVDLSFGVGGHYLNLENFTKDFATGRFPRLLNLTASIITDTTTARSCNDYLYDQPTVVKRNLSILPCDDGNFLPNFFVLGSYTTGSSKQRDVLDSFEPSFVSLENMLNGILTFESLNGVESGSLYDSLIGPSPEGGKVNIRPSTRERGLSIYQRTRDASSNEVAMFDISNLFFGSRIMPGSFTLSDNDITGSDGKISITLKDDGMGGLYRADCNTAHATWANVGNVLYEDGFAVVKTPVLPFFGKTGYEVDLRGEQEIHVLKVNVIAHASTLNSSSNATYQPISASFSADDDEQKFVYITNVNLHDENLNVVMKAQLAQPIIKRPRSKFLFRIRHDF